MLQIFLGRYSLQKLSNASNFLVHFLNRHIYKNSVHQKILRLETSTFQPRILKYFLNDSDEFKSKKLNYSSHHYKPDSLRKVDNIELNNLIHSLLVGNFRGNFKHSLHYLDKECCFRLKDLTFAQVYEILNIFFYYTPHQITSLEFYKKSIHMISFSVDSCSKMELIKLCFYVALQKKSKQSQRILTECVTCINKKYLNDVNINDTAIICNACYKTSTKIKFKSVLSKIAEILNNNLNVLNDAPIFIEIVKSLRHNQCQDEEILTTISHTIFFNETINSYNFTACSHILTLYADALFYDDKLIKLLINKCVTFLQNSKLPESKKEHFSSQIRIKDLDNFLWSLSYLGYEELDESIIQKYLEPYLKKYITLDNFGKDVENVINILLSLWLLAYKPSNEVLTSVISNNTAATIYAKRKEAYISRFNLLLTCIKLEHEELFNKLNVKYISPPEFVVESQLKNRPLLTKLHDSVSRISPKFDITKVEYTMEIPHLHIMGITGYNKQNKILYVEFVDEQLLVKNVADKPNGFMNLKIRLLRRNCKNILVIYQSEVQKKNKTELDKYVEKKLKRIYVP